MDDPDVVSLGEGVEGCVGEPPAQEAAEEEDYGAAGGRAVVGVGDSVSIVVRCVCEEAVEADGAQELEGIVRCLRGGMRHLSGLTFGH